MIFLDSIGSALKIEHRSFENSGPDSAFGQALLSPRRTGRMTNRYGDDARGILIERNAAGSYSMVFYREGHPLIISSLLFATKSGVALGALTTAKGVYGDWLKANRKTEWAKRLKADARAKSDAAILTPTLRPSETQLSSVLSDR